MSRFFVHYKPDNGEILGHEITEHPGEKAGCERVELNCVSRTLDPRLYRIDPKTFMLVEKTTEERRLSLLPSLREVQEQIFYELRGTDGEVVADRPMPDERRNAWQSYRQTLRDLSKLATPVDMVRAWPVRPDGADAIMELRGRVADQST